jgi:hypothetical protein
VLLCGYHPFDMGDDPKDVIQDRVARGDVLPMEGPQGHGWERVSDAAKEFVRACLVCLLQLLQRPPQPSFKFCTCT